MADATYVSPTRAADPVGDAHSSASWHHRSEGKGHQ